MVFPGKLRDEALCQRDDVLPALPQGRQGDVDGVDAVVQVLAETAGPHQGLQVQVGGADEPDIDRNRLAAAHADDAAALERPQELGLQVQGNVADLVQEECAAVGLLELARMVGMGIGKCALDVAEEFAFEQGLRDGAGVYRHHRLVLPQAPGVNLAGQHVLAGSVLAGDEDGGVGGGDFVQGLADGGHGAGTAPEHGIFAAGFFVALSVAAHRLAGLVAGGGQRGRQFFVVPGLHDEVERPPLHSFDGQGDVGVGREQHDLHFGGQFLDLPGPVEPLVAGVDLRFEVHVQQHHVGPETLQGVHQGHRRRQGLYLREIQRKQDFQRLADAGVVVHDEYFPDFLCHLLVRIYAGFLRNANHPVR